MKKIKGMKYTGKEELEVLECERCGVRGIGTSMIDDIPAHGYTMTLCRRCYRAAQVSGELE